MSISLKFRSVAALSALALLTVLNYFIQNYHTQTVDNDAHLLNQAGRQRMLATRVAYLSSQLLLYGDEPAASGEIRQRLLQTAKEMAEQHDSLVHERHGFIDDLSVRHIFFEAPDMLDQKVHAYVASARGLANSRSEAPRRGDSYYAQIDSLETPLVEMMDRAVMQYELSADRRIKSLHLFEIAGMLVQFAGLFATWLMIFRPMGLRVKQYWGAQDRVNADLVRSNMALAAQKEALAREKEIADNLRQRLQAILDAAGEGITGLDLDGNIIFANVAATRLLGYPLEQLLGVNHHQLLHRSYEDGSAFPQEQCLIHAAIVEGQSYHSDTETFWHADGTALPVDVVSMPLYEHSVLVGAVLVFGDISRRKKAEEVIQCTMRELERSNRELDDFAYIASHDLKEPLRGIHNYSSFLLEDHGAHLDEEGRRYLETLLRLTQRMETLVDTLLHYSRLGRARLNIEECDLNELLAEAIDSLMIQEKHAEVRLTCQHPRLACNRVMVVELLHNLIVNGLKYNENTEKSIEVGCNQGPKEMIYYVKDNGIGIPEKHQESIFRIFKRLHGRDKYGGGTGAGLTIVKKIVERHGGKVWVESRMGEGSIFYFTLGNMGSDEHQIESADSDR
ncbi:MAG: PAS domain S-box protein [Sulfuricella denitrificans]|nr:PAS domain S-box protein [Sulfuricella denitrificans]